MLVIYIVCTIIIDSNKEKGGKLFEAFLVTVLANVISHFIIQRLQRKRTSQRPGKHFKKS